MRAMPTYTQDLSVPGINSTRNRPGQDTHRSDRFLRIDMLGNHKIDPLQRTVRNHSWSPADALLIADFFRWLEQKADPPREFLLGQDGRCPERHSGVTVMA